jgi:hypothetical protein
MPWIRLALRGERPLGEKTALRFRYHLTGDRAMRVTLVGPAAPETAALEGKALTAERWAEATLDFAAKSGVGDGVASDPHQDGRVKEIRFLLPRGSALLVAEVLLYEPASPAKP